MADDFDLVDSFEIYFCKRFACEKVKHRKGKKIKQRLKNKEKSQLNFERREGT